MWKLSVQLRKIPEAFNIRQKKTQSLKAYTGQLLEPFRLLNQLEICFLFQAAKNQQPSDTKESDIAEFYNEFYEVLKDKDT